MGKHAGRFALGALFAAAAGYVAGILTAPKSGKETREDIKNAANKKIAEIERELKKKHTELTALIKDASERAQQAKGTVKKEIEDRVDKAMRAKDKVRIALSGVRDGETSDSDLQKAIDEAEKAVEHLKKYLKK